jgi:hypothetical protein
MDLKALLSMNGPSRALPPQAKALSSAPGAGADITSVRFGTMEKAFTVRRGWNVVWLDAHAIQRSDGGPTPARLRARKAGYEKSQMITVASGRPIPNDQPMTIASAKSKPTPARNAGNDMPLLL